MQRNPVAGHHGDLLWRRERQRGDPSIGRGVEGVKDSASPQLAEGDGRGLAEGVVQIDEAVALAVDAHAVQSAGLGQSLGRASGEGDAVEVALSGVILGGGEVDRILSDADG